MQTPVQISFKDMPVSDALESACLKEVEKLEQFYDRITSCRVVVEEPHRRHRKGNLFRIRIHAVVPNGGEIVVDRQPAADQAREDAYVAVREAFSAARRQLEDHVRKLRGKVKHHEEPPHGTVCDLQPDFGYIRTPGDREVYFHQSNVLEGGFHELQVGTEVRFVEEEGDKGWQATSVRPLRRHTTT